METINKSLSPRSKKLYILGLFCLAFLIRLHSIGRESFWYDELCSIYYSSPELPITNLFLDNSPPLFHLLLKIWIFLLQKFWPIFDPIFAIDQYREGAARALCAFISALSIPTFFYWGKITKGHLRGTLLALGLACSSLSIRYAQELRMYSLFEFLFIIFLFTIWRHKIQPSKKTFLQLLAASLALSLTHFLAIPAIILAIPCFLKKELTHRRDLQFYLGLIMAPSLLLFLWQFRWSAVEWQKNIFSYSTFWQSGYRFFLSYGQLRLSCVLLMIFTCVYAHFKGAKRDREILGSLSLYAALIIGSTVLLEIVFGRICLKSHYFIFLNPIILSIFILSLERLNKYFVLVGMMLFCTTFTKAYLHENSQWREASKFLTEHKATQILTTKSKAIRRPYLDQAEITIESISLNSDFLEKIKFKLSNSKAIWILDDFASLHPRMPKLLNELEKAHLSAVVSSFGNEPDTTIYTIEISKMAEAPFHAN